MVKKPILSATELSKSFGGLGAVHGMSLTLEQGLITGLIGPNGAGKSTFFNLISGVIWADSDGVNI